MVVAALTEVPSALTAALTWLKLLWARLASACRGCPTHCPESRGPVVTVISSGPPERSPVDILLDPPKLELK